MVFLVCVFHTIYPGRQSWEMIMAQTHNDLETIMVSKKIIRMGAQKTPRQKTYEIKTGSDSLNVEFLGASRQFDWLEILIVNDKSDTHTTIYVSYN